ncbi:GreA/GreB family elongation factor [Bizionia gelidisalsuginis]|uniref:GreA/GreB family elongation factor n=1 Tax=Bizionia gelidisalsuginis TaxID=291188 RepID=A0ABY3MEW9_9FLAO|nr:GreA/GreB family elongation factor [Bizionia gelidisalsuginis]TYC18156.1 GreA/GreB family elongation factor [Bizionia gelidisalsuginis]
MSRGFVKEEDQEEVPMVPPRADLPDGVINYVTQVGMNALLEEREALTTEREHLEITNEKERRIVVNHINAKLQLLNNRIATAKIVDLKKQPQNEVRFGALVALKIGNAMTVQNYQIVGVDEADIAKGKIAFISPIAKILVNKKVGEYATLKLPTEERVFEIKEIAY